jgi:SAM-dependent methyltransferase
VRLKADWLPLLHRFRRREIEIAFAGCPEKAFATGLELGAGDGFQSRLLTRWVSGLVSTDFDPGVLDNPPDAAITWAVCDAEEVDRVFAGRRFDLVFSSNLLEHLPDPARALRAMHAVLADDGVAIHVVPGPFWKTTHLLLHVPNRCALILERLMRPGAIGAVGRKLRGTEPEAVNAPPRDNNPKTARVRRGAVARFLWPVPHGVSRGNLGEFLAFRRSRWKREIRAAGFDLIAVRKGPVASGYGFGFDRTRRALEALGLASEFVYVARKRGASSPCAAFWCPEGP